MSKLLLSVIIPTYKRNEKLKKIIDRLVSQSLLSINIEIIIISNTKLNLGIFFNYLNKKKNIKLKILTVKKNSNAIKRNKGIKSANGKF